MLLLYSSVAVYGAEENLHSSSDWTVITVTFNSKNDLLAHWPADPESRNYTWIVVDNGSTDGTLEAARARADVVIENTQNVGFSAGNNCALPHVETKFVAFANPDVRVDQEGWGELAAVAMATGGLVAPQLVNPDGSAQPNARGLPYLSSKLLNRLLPRKAQAIGYISPKIEQPTYCAWVMGAAVGGSTSCVRQLGGWDEKYFLYYEDHDLGLRAWRCGVPVVVVPGVRWTHSWARATAGINLRAWLREICSMVKFYSSYPELLLRTPKRQQWLVELTERSWRQVEGVQW